MEHVLQPTQETTQPEEPQVFGLEDDSTEEALDALSSGTARSMFAALHEEPRTPTELREAVGTSLQNVHYHVENLESAGLIREVGTRYSEKGNEMAVYGPTSEAIVFMAGDDEDVSLLRRAVTRLVGGLGALAAASLAVGQLLGDESGGAATDTSGGSAGVEMQVAERGAEVTSKTAAGGGGIDPALLFFLGGLFVLSVAGVWWLYGQTR